MKQIGTELLLQAIELQHIAWLLVVEAMREEQRTRLALLEQARLLALQVALDKEKHESD